MAQTEEEKLQKQLEDQLAKNDVKVADDKANEMKDRILSASEGAWLGVGVHEVYIKSVELTQAKTGTLGMKFNVHNEDGQNYATFWLSEAALPYTIENVSRLVVHNTPEDKKDAARTFMSNVTSAKELLAVAKEKLVDGVAYLVIKQSETNTYKDSNGVDRPSLERNLQAWKPKQTQEEAVKQVMNGGEEITKENLGDLPF